MSDRHQQWISAMRAERYEDAWALQAASLAERDSRRRDDPSLPYHSRWVWDGRGLDGEDVLVRCYHGHGDTIQFARYLPFLERRARRLTVEVPERLIDLIRPLVSARCALVPFDHAHPLPARRDIEITELDFALRLSPQHAPPPYLQAAQAILPSQTVALCYQAGDWDSHRSISANLLTSLCSRGPTLTLVPEPTSLPVINPEGCPFDIMATASLVKAADLVITVDTMLAHIAGALGKPTWLMLKAKPDWRWNPRRRCSPWYPSMRLYVQPTAGDWRSVIARIERDLAMRGIVSAER